MPPAAQAAGGHHAVEDAAVLDPGQCQVESWWDDELGGERTLLHAGTACRIAAVELGLNVDRLRSGGEGTTTALSAQLKWARPVADGLSIGVLLSAGSQDHAPKFLGSALVVPVTWQAAQALLVHANFGREFRHAQADSSRGGVAFEWTPLAAWTFVGERFREFGVDAWRAGARWNLAPSVNVDLSRAHALGAGDWWTLGLTWVFER